MVRLYRSMANVMLGACNDRAVLLANEPDITGGAVDLRPLPRHAGPTISPGEQAERAGLAPPLAASRKPQLILRANARRDRFAAWRHDTRCSATPFNFTDQAFQAGLRELGVMLVDRLSRSMASARAGSPCSTRNDNRRNHRAPN